MKHLFIINPAAGKRNQTVAFTKKIAAFCKPRGMDYEIRVSSRPGNCTELARQAAQTGEDYRIYACGGDGTLNEVIQGVVGHPNVAVTHFRGGSGNDFIRMFGDMDAFADLARLTDCQETRMDLIRVGDVGYGLNICSMGIDARIVVDMWKYKHLPLLTGHGAYNFSTVVNLIKGLKRPFEIEVEGETIRGDQTLVCVCNGRYYGGGYLPVPEAEPDDGLLDVLVIQGVSRLTAAGVIGTYKRGEYATRPDVITHYRTRQITVRCPDQSPVNVDGEIFLAREIEFSVAPEKLRFFYPKDLTWDAGRK